MVDDYSQCGAHHHIQRSVPDLDGNIYTPSHSTPVESSISFIRFVGLGVLFKFVFQLLRQLKTLLIEGWPKLSRNYKRRNVE